MLSASTGESAAASRSGKPGGEQDRAEAQRHGGENGPWRDEKILDTGEDVERGDGLRNSADELTGEDDAEDEAQRAADNAEHERLGHEEGLDLESAQAERAEHADLVAAPHDCSGHRVVDEKHADEQCDERERGEVELERAEHPLDLAVAAVGRLDDDVGGKLGAKAGADGVEIGAGPQQRGDAGELAGVEKIFLHVGDVHDGEMFVDAGRVVAEIEDVADAEGFLCPAASRGGADRRF